MTGIGCVNPMGHDVATMWQALQEGGSGVAETTIFDASQFPTRIAAEVKDWDVTAIGEDPLRWKHRSRHTCFAAGAAHQAVHSSGVLESQLDPTRFGIYLGSGEGTQDFDTFAKMMVASLADGEFDMNRFTRAGREMLDPVFELEQEPNIPAGHLAGMFNAQGPNANCLTACAASSQAVGEATEIIRRGEADVMLSGGTHSMIHPLGVTGFNLLTALSTRNDEPKKASRPFDRLRDGFVLGEGAGMVILEELDRAKREVRISLAKSRVMVRPQMPIESPTSIPRGVAQSVASAWPCRMPALILRKSTTSTPMEPAPRSTTAWKRSPAKRSSAPMLRLFPARRA